MTEKKLPGMGARENASFPLPQRRLMIVAQSPGRYVDPPPPREEWPLMQKLELWLSDAGFRPGMVDRAYITNAYPYHVNVLTPRLLLENRDWLMEQVREVNPDVIMCVGSVAAASVAWDVSPRDRQMGMMFQAEVEGTRTMIVFPHTSSRSRATNTEEGKAALANAVKWLGWAKRTFKLDP
jgi:hypothetical protein